MKESVTDLSDKEMAVQWRFLSRLFRYPDEHLVLFFARNHEVNEEFFPGISAWISGVHKGCSALSELEEEYTRLFITSWPTVQASPYEAVFRRDVSPSEVLIELSEFYLSAGLSCEEGFAGESFRPDHLVVELEFAANLLERGERKKHDAFIDMHPARWIDDFCDAVLRESSHILYHRAADLLKEAVSRYRSESKKSDYVTLCS